MSDQSRVEQLLRNALGEDIYEVTPQSRVEELLTQLNELIEEIGTSGGTTPDLTNYVQFTDLATTTSAGAMSATDKGRLDTLYADYSSALTALGVS